MSNGQILSKCLTETLKELIQITDETDSTLQPALNCESLPCLGEELHNPGYDSKLVHPLGKFCHSFLLFRADLVGAEAIKYFRSLVGKKRGPYMAHTDIPVSITVSESLDDQLSNLKRRKASHPDEVPILFIMAAQNYDRFDGKKKNPESGRSLVCLDKDFQFNVVQVNQVKVEKESRLARYLPVDTDLNVV